MLYAYEDGRACDWQLSGGKMRVVVTGSSGFIGSHLVISLANLGHSVLGIDVKQPTQSTLTAVIHKENVQEHGLDCFSFQQCNILDAIDFQRALADYLPQVVIHLAARTDLDSSADLHDYAANIDGVSNLVSAVNSIPSLERCIYTSSQLVCRPGYTPETDVDYQPHTIYGESKVMTEKIVREADYGNVTWCLVRPTTVWGPGMNPHYQRFFKMIADGRYFHVGYAELRKSYGYVGNVVHQYMKLVEAPKDQIHGKTLYLADYQPLSLRTWADMLSIEFGAAPIRTIPVSVARLVAGCGDLLNTCGFRNFPFNSFRLANVLNEYQVDMSETETICGSTPFTVQQGVTETAKWHKGSVRA